MFNTSHPPWFDKCSVKHCGDLWRGIFIAFPRQGGQGGKSTIAPPSTRTPNPELCFLGTGEGTGRGVGGGWWGPVASADPTLSAETRLFVLAWAWLCVHSCGVHFYPPGHPAFAFAPLSSPLLSSPLRSLLCSTLSSTPHQEMSAAPQRNAPLSF